MVMVAISAIARGGREASGARTALLGPRIVAIMIAAHLPDPRVLLARFDALQPLRAFDWSRLIAANEQRKLSRTLSLAF
jgi:hypothetical protein